MVTGTNIDDLALLGGDLALDFANTLVGPRDVPPDRDFVDSYADLVTWALRTGALPAGARPRGGDADLERARALREAVFDVFAAHAAGSRPPAAALEAVLAAHVDAVREGTLEDGRWVWSGRHADRPVWPVAVAAVDLLRSDRLVRVKLCGACRWLFLDRSRNRSRRWCTMDECGAQAKMRRYRAARRGG